MRRKYLPTFGCEGGPLIYPISFALGTYAQREGLRHTNSPPRGPESATPLVVSYDSYCSFVVNQLKRATVLFPKDSWFHEMLEEVEGQIPADHINGHGPDCQCVWQAVYFACRAHFHGETAEMIWGFLNPLGASTRQMTGGARHDTINFVIDAWNTRKVLRQGESLLLAALSLSLLTFYFTAELLAGERADALRLFELHMAVLEDLSRQHSTEVGGWSRLSRKVSKSDDGKLASVYQHQSTKGTPVSNRGRFLKLKKCSAHHRECACFFARRGTRATAAIAARSRV